MFKRRLLVIVAGVLVSALFIVLALRGIDLSKVRDAFSRAQLLPWVPLALGFFLIGYALRGVRCWLLVRRTHKIAATTATGVLLVGYGANNVFPARLGELVRAGMLAERAHMPVSQALGITFIERVLDGLSLLVFLIVATMGSHVPAWMHEVVYLAIGVFGVATIAILIATVWPDFLISLSGKLGGILGAKWRERFTKLATHITASTTCLRDPKMALALVALSLVIWCFEAALYTLFLPIFGIPLSVEAGVVTMSVTGFGLLLPSSPGFIGPFHYFASQTLMVYGVAQSDALAYATLTHLGFYIPLTILGASVMMWYGVELSSTVARSSAPSDALGDHAHGVEQVHR